MAATATFLFFIFFFLTSLTWAQQRANGSSNPHILSEIQALTSFKLTIHDPLGHLDGWDASTPRAPCDWTGVVCHQNRVREIRLPRLQLGGRLSPRLAELRELRKLSLHSNNLNGSIPPSLSRCALLRAVYLHNNSLSGGLPPSLLNLNNLQVLNVARNFLSGKIAAVISPALRYLDVSSNAFSGEMPANFSFSSQLQLISFSFNRFSGEVPAAIGALQQLEYLFLDSNRLYGTLPSAIANCSSLVYLSAGDNSLRGLIPATVGAIPKLQVLSLSRNNFSGSVPVSLLCNPSLRIVDIGFNALTGMVKPPNGKRASSSSSGLECLDLKQNHIQGLFPSWLTSLTTLRALDLSGNFFTGPMRVQIGNLLRLEELRLANNSLSGQVLDEVSQCGSLKVLDLEGNQFSGQIPSQLGGLKSLKELSLGRNFFSGSIPTSLGAISGLETLNLGSNNLGGRVPEKLMKLSNLTTLDLSNNKLSGEVLRDIGELKNLRVLNLSNCGFSGRFPTSIGNLMKLSTLDLSKQSLSGQLPVEIFGLPSLQVVALQENRLSGDVPEGFSSLVGLQYLNLSSNVFTGDIPTTYGFLRSLNVLSLSSNRISGVIPVEIGNCSELRELGLRSNRLVGNIPGDISGLSRLKKLDLGENKLTGEIPEEISKCSSLSSLSLDVNQLSGHIPNSLPRLSNLMELNLSSNRLSGVIPLNISFISSLKYLNLSRNDLEGEIPKPLGSRFSDPSVFAMNLKLCGKPLHRECASMKRRKRRKLILFIGVSVAGACLLALCCCGYIFSLLRWHKRIKEGVAGGKKRSPARASTGVDRSRGSGENGELVMFNNKITLAETLEATRNFDEENVLSRGKYGLVFKASFQDGMVLSIHRLADGFLDEGGFRKEAESLCKVKHRNLTILRGYYAGPPDVRLLVYDYMPNGNLATLLQEASHQDGHVLNWPMRHLIALGIARGLAFLHSLSIVHGDIKPQNVLFDADFEAHLSEFGLDRLTISTPTEGASSSSTPVGSLGYVSPEAALTGQATKEADVYSFGIVVLEILTGRKPVVFTQDEDIVKWVKRQLQRGQIAELLEPGLLEIDPESSEWEEFLLGVKVGLLCTAPDPLDRPSMADIVFMLEGCRVGPDIPSSADPTSLPSPA
ncbi:putative LRR receptor-like serine/threonine-protein kinase [Morus notabilis]|uniref:Putative LRR receptor-like serine/threonine-protein kinase n=1 Tax=Morus notabilis TaxID=981085 RepID=W9QZI0_9ROSA|nr:probable LRR receptor-like serine/threonine-protein kinase At4g36180 [Morus notabilis]EXB60658.1 putative LRR receptor-like serine/threonine-protein kinase [Morus notabilis]